MYKQYIYDNCDHLPPHVTQSPTLYFIKNSYMHQIFQNITKYKLFNNTNICTSLQISKIYRYK